MRPNSRTDPAAARCEDIDEERTKKPEEKRGTSAAGNRDLVYTARIGLVHHAEAAVYLAHYRSQHKRQRKSRKEDYGKRSKPMKKCRHFESPPSSSIRDRRLESPASSLLDAFTVTMTQRSMRLHKLRSTTSRKMRETWLAVLNPS